MAKTPTIEELKNLEGYTNLEVANMFGVTRNAVYLKRKRNNLAFPRRHKRPTIILNRIAALFEKKREVTLQDIIQEAYGLAEHDTSEASRLYQCCKDNAGRIIRRLRTQKGLTIIYNPTKKTYRRQK